LPTILKKDCKFTGSKIIYKNSFQNDQFGSQNILESIQKRPYQTPFTIQHKTSTKYAFLPSSCKILSTEEIT